MKNHFYIPYSGNKRNEIKLFYNDLNFESIDTVVEPYCGSCAMSYYIWTQKPNMKFLLNDNNIFLKEMYEIMIDEKKCIEFEETFKSLVKSFDGKKDKYKEIVNKKDSLLSWFIANKIYNIRAGIFPLPPRTYKKEVKLSEFPIYDFFRKADIKFSNEDGIEFYKSQCKIKTNMLLIDPPYMNSCNAFYENPGLNIYEFLYENNIKNEPSKIYLILENIWIIKMLFKDNKNLNSYDKQYAMSQKQTSHIVMCNQ
jgi:hypothetical protein